MRILIFIISFFILFHLHGQQPTLAYEAYQDSNDYISHLRQVNQQLYFYSGKCRNPKNVSFCGFGGPQDIRERHVYNFQREKAKKIFHHNLENDFARSENKMVDSSKIFSTSKFFEFSDSTGVFLDESGKNFYWLKKNDTYRKVTLPKGKSVSSYYPEWHNDKLFVKGHDTLIAGKLFYFNPISETLHPFLKDTFSYKTHNPIFHKDKIIFHGYSKKNQRDHALFIAEENKPVIKITQFEQATIFSTFLFLHSEKIYYRITHRGIKGSYTNTDFTNTEIWEYDIQSNQTKMIHDFGKYGLTYSPVLINDNIYFTFGYNEYAIHKITNGKVEKVKTDKKEIEFTTSKLIHFDNKIFFTGANNEQRDLYYIDNQDEIRKVKQSIGKVHSIQIIDNTLLLGFFDIQNQLDFYILNNDDYSLIKASDISLPKDQLKYKIDKIGNSVFLSVTRKLQTDLYQLSNNCFKLIHEDVQLKRYAGHFDYTLIDHELFFISRKNKNSKFNQLWKISQ